MITRLINIELKINRVMERQGPEEWSGHPDQAFGATTYAQHGEDLVIVNIFHRLGIAKPSYLDVGAHHPLSISNTALLYKLGSRGVNVEANPDLIGSFHEHRPDDINLNVGAGTQTGMMTFYRIDRWSGRNSFDKASIDEFVKQHPEFSVTDQIEVPVLSLNDIVREHCGGRFPNFLSIDVEGLDYAILDAADMTTSSPDLICVETVSGADRNDSAKIQQMLRGKGFTPVFETIGNAFFVADRHAAAFQYER